MAQPFTLMIPVLEPMIEQHPDQAALMQSASSLYELGLRWNPSDARARYGLGTVSLVTGQYFDAIEHLSRAIGSETRDPLGHLRLGSALWNSGDDTNAVAAFQRANASNFLVSRGDQYGANAKLALAETYYQVASLIREQTRAYSGLGQVRQAQGRWQESRDYFLRALQVDPNNVEAELGLSNVFLYGLGDPRAARPHVRRAVDLQPGLWAYLLMGDSYRLDKDYAEAAQWYGQAAVADPKSELPLIFQGWNLQAQGNLDKAIELFRAAQIRNPLAAQADTALAALYVQRGDRDSAITSY
ncbi:MAG: tetratricopeptide repeat protein, partial [Anaerolineales bacterium]